MCFHHAQAACFEVAAGSGMKVCRISRWRASQAEIGDALLEHLLDGAGEQPIAGGGVGRVGVGHGGHCTTRYAILYHVVHD